jgi:hypothetical protein
MDAWHRLNERVESVNDHSYRRVVPVDPEFLSDALESRSYALWCQTEDNPLEWHERA